MAGVAERGEGFEGEKETVKGGVKRIVVVES